MFRSLTNVFHKISRQARSTNTRTARPSFHPRLEALEERAVPTVWVYTYNGDLIVYSDDLGDNVEVNYQYWGGVGYYVAKENYAGGGYRNYWYPTSTIWGGDVYFHGNGGNDVFTNNTYLRSVAYGNDGADSLTGGYSSDFLEGGMGGDSLLGREGNDTLLGGVGYTGGYDVSTNVLFGGYGYDTLYGGNGVDMMFGGNNFNYGDEYSTNTLIGNDGPDALYGSSGTDYLHGGLGADYLYGSYGIDYLYGGNDDDTLIGGLDGQADYLNGGAGADSFKEDGYWWYFQGYWMWFNRDYPADFSSAEGDRWYPY